MEPLDTAIGRALDDYQNWTLTTAVYPEALALPYLGLGLGDEVGELVEKSEDPGHTLRTWGSKELLPEVGDVGWYLAQLLHRSGIRLSEAFALSAELQPGFDATLHSAVTSIVVRASKVQGRLKKSIRDGVDVKAPVLEHAAHIVRAMDAIARFYGSNLLLVLGDNRQKLEDRLKRNAIKGEGDHR